MHRHIFLNIGRSSDLGLPICCLQNGTTDYRGEPVYRAVTATDILFEWDIAQEA